MVAVNMADEDRVDAIEGRLASQHGPGNVLRDQRIAAIAIGVKGIEKDPGITANDHDAFVAKISRLR